MSDSEPSIDQLEKIVKREMALFETSKSLPKNLSNLKKAFFQSNQRLWNPIELYLSCIELPIDQSINRLQWH